MFFYPNGRDGCIARPKHVSEACCIDAVANNLTGIPRPTMSHGPVINEVSLDQQPSVDEAAVCPRGLFLYWQKLSQ